MGILKGPQVEGPPEEGLIKGLLGLIYGVLTRAPVVFKGPEE